MIVRYSISFGRPPGARKKYGYTVTWIAWWGDGPTHETQLRPNAFGGAVSRDQVPEIVSQHASRFSDACELEQLPARWCQQWRRARRGQLPGNESWRPSADQQSFGPKFAPPPFSSFFGFASSPPSAKPQVDPALAALGLGADATEADVQRAFRARARAAHPDRGGTEPAFKALNNHYQEALRLVREGAT